VVASPRPQGIFEIRLVKWLLEEETIVICAGGRGIPTCCDEKPQVERCGSRHRRTYTAALLADEPEVDLLVIATDIDTAYVNCSKPTQKAIAQRHSDELEKLGFAAGSMGPKVQAACEFAQDPQGRSNGALPDIVAITGRTAGTAVSMSEPRVHFYSPT
jgi:carbamate kinase